MTNAPLHRTTARPWLLAAVGLITLHAHAQQVFRIVGPDGKVTFSDKPPEVAAPPSTQPAAAGARAPSTAAAPAPSLPFALRQVATRYPVVLYTGKNCAPCGLGRSLLATRGIPFSEKTVNGNDDIDALQRLSGGTTLPFLTIGGQQIKGFSELEWTQFLDAAGYPKTSQLPASYRQAAAAPLVASQSADAPAAPGTRPLAASAGGQPPVAADAPPPPPPESETPANPAGIRF
jgi:glutaredoxin